MKTVKLGRTGLEVSRICLGCMSFGDPGWRPWVLSEDAARPFFARALELGINFFDTADMYSRGRSEEITGKALGELARRDEVVIATKVYFPVGKGPNQGGLGRKHVLSAIDASLRRLGTDYVDLYQIHRWDEGTPIEETLEALHDVVRAGKARYVGASSMYAWQLAKSLFTADLRGWTRFVSMQNHYNLVYREEERETIPLCRDQGLGIIPWSPLARGLLAGNRTRGGEERTTRAASDDYSPRLYRVDADFDVVDRCMEVAREVGASPSQVALAWLLGKPGVTAPIVGATKMAHLEEAVAALDVELSEGQVRRLEEPYVPHPVLGHG
ncbi:MAG TPA: aldo/keto reductase [Thermoanaerobaculia bacterium]